MEFEYSDDYISRNELLRALSAAEKSIDPIRVSKAIYDLILEIPAANVREIHSCTDCENWPFGDVITDETLNDPRIVESYEKSVCPKCQNRWNSRFVPKQKKKNKIL